MDEIVGKVAEAAPASAVPPVHSGSLDLVWVAQESCFTHGAIANPVPVETDVWLNGQGLEVR